MPISANFTSAFNYRSTNCSGACNSDNVPLPLPLSLTLFRLSPGPLRLRFRGSGRLFWMGDRAVDCARLESVCAERHRGFESPPIRPASRLRSCSLAFLDHMQFLSQLHPASMREDA